MAIQKKKPPVYAANNEKTENVRQLCEKWTCKKPTAKCGGTYCFVEPDSSTHIILGHKHFDGCATAMVSCVFSRDKVVSDNEVQLKLDGVVTIEKPPHNKLFDLTQAAKMSPVLECRKANQATASSSTPAAAPVFNFSLGNDFAQIFHPNQAPVPSNISAPNTTSSKLISSGCKVGPDMPLAKFSSKYNLGPHILKLFEENGYTHSRHLRFVELEELKEMKFRLGKLLLSRMP